ncbi:MAG: dolichol-phosphate hexosyltransferase [Thermoproteota archaeon]|nr:dolichol-phosphate hexosyltransferase [Thermoproteota archaeon]
MEELLKTKSRNSEIVCIIPTLNEGATVAEVVRKSMQFVDRVVVVDGYSNDGTSQIASEAGAEVIFQEGKGKGMALRTVFEKVKSDVYVIIDGDATYDAFEMENLINPVLNGEVDMVVGSRLKGNMEKGAITRTNKIGNGVFNFLINTLFNGKVSDSQSGYRVMNRDVIEKLNLTSKGFEVETEITVKALKQDLKIVEVPITYTKRRGTPTKLNSFKAGLRIVRTILGSSV